MKKLLLVGSNTIHTYNYVKLIENYFDDILLITNEKREGFDLKSKLFNFSLTLTNLYKTTKEIRKTINEYKPSIIHVHQVNSYALYTILANRKAKIPVVITAWGSDILVSPKKSNILKFIVKFILRKADFLTSDSQYMLEDMQKLQNPKNKILLANFGIDLPNFKRDKANVIYSNRLHKPLYRIDTIIDIFHEFIQLNQEDWKLVIAATGEETDHLKAKVESLKLNSKIEFVGWLSPKENAEWYAKSRFWISIPESDATSISLLEAMSHECIPIVSDLPANREWITNGKNGIIVSQYDPSIFEEALHLNLEEAIQININLIANNATKEVNSAKFIELYSKLMN
jgi:glycosyltransferase involved in cell wall biosynthesis